jgi:flagellar basal-body rod protein FlgB
MVINAPSLVEQFAAAMSASQLRHETIASNIANRDTPGYQRLAVRFDRAMDRAVAVPDPSGGRPAPEQDLVSMSSNAMHYQALARVLGRYFSIASIIASQGRG